MTDLQMLFDIRGSTAVITGGSGGLGSVMALALAAEVMTTDLFSDPGFLHILINDFSHSAIR